MARSVLVSLSQLIRVVLVSCLILHAARRIRGGQAELPVKNMLHAAYIMKHKTLAKKSKRIELCTVV